MPAEAYRPSSDEKESVVVLRARKGWQGIDVKELWAHRELLTTLARRDIKVRYAQTVLGVAWIVLQPLCAAVVFAFVFGLVANLPSEGLPYIVFSFAGLLGWGVFANTLSRVSGSLVANSALIAKTYFPRLIVPLAMVPSMLLDFVVAGALLAAMMAIYRIAPTWGLATLPIWILLLVAVAMGAGLIAGALAVRYRDVNYAIPVALQLLLYASPIAYSLSVVPTKWKTLFLLNPLAPLLDAFRWSILGTGEVVPWALAYAGGLGVVLLAIGALLFRKMEREFADVI